MGVNPAAPAVRVAFAGAGGMAAEHARAFADVPGVKLAGIHSRTRARAEALASQHGMEHVCDSVAELYERLQAELLVIAVSELSAREVCEQACRFPWTILKEKPPGYSPVEARLIAQAVARKPGGEVFVALNRRFYGSTLRVFAELRTQKGKRHIHVQDQQSRRHAAALGHPAALVENWHYANSIHLVDYFRVLGRGGVRRVESLFGASEAEQQIVAAKLEFESGDTGLYEAIWSGPGPWAVAVTTSERRWEMRPLESLAYQDAGSRQLVAVPADEADQRFKPGLRVQAQEAVAAALGRPHRLPTFADALASMELVGKIYARADAQAGTKAGHAQKTKADL